MAENAQALNFRPDFGGVANRWEKFHENSSQVVVEEFLGGGFKYVLFSPLTLGKISILTNTHLSKT